MEYYSARVFGVYFCFAMYFLKTVNVPLLHIDRRKRDLWSFRTAEER